MTNTGPRSDITVTAPTREGNGWSRRWTRTLVGVLFAFTAVVMPSGELRYTVRRHSGANGGRPLFDAEWSLVHSITVTPQPLTWHRERPGRYTAPGLEIVRQPNAGRDNTWALRRAGTTAEVTTHRLLASAQKAGDRLAAIDTANAVIARLADPTGEKAAAEGAELHAEALVMHTRWTAHQARIAAAKRREPRELLPVGTPVEYSNNSRGGHPTNVEPGRVTTVHNGSMWVTLDDRPGAEQLVGPHTYCEPVEAPCPAGDACTGAAFPGHPEHPAREITFPTPICSDDEPHERHRVAGTWREECPGVRARPAALPIEEPGRFAERGRPSPLQAIERLYRENVKWPTASRIVRAGADLDELHTAHDLGLIERFEHPARGLVYRLPAPDADRPLTEHDVVTLTPLREGRQFDVIALGLDDMVRVAPRNPNDVDDAPRWVSTTYVHRVPVSLVEPVEDDDEQIAGPARYVGRRCCATTEGDVHDRSCDTPEGRRQWWGPTARAEAERAGKAYGAALALHVGAMRAGRVADADRYAEALPGLRNAALAALADVDAVEREYGPRAAAATVYGRCWHGAIVDLRSAGWWHPDSGTACDDPGPMVDGPMPFEQAAVERAAADQAPPAEPTPDELRGTHADHMRKLAGPAGASATVEVSRRLLARLADQLAPPHTECKAAALARRAIAVQHAVMVKLVDLASKGEQVEPELLLSLALVAAEAMAAPAPDVDLLVAHIKRGAGSAIVADETVTPADVDALIARMVADGWTEAGEPEYVFGKRIRYLTPPTAVAAGVHDLPAAAPRHQAPEGVPFVSCTLHGADCKAAQNGRPCSGMPADEPVPLNVDPQHLGRVLGGALSDPPADEQPVPFEHNGRTFPGYVAGRCGHRVAESEWQSGFRVCERCHDGGEPGSEV